MKRRMDVFWKAVFFEFLFIQAAGSLTMGIVGSIFAEDNSISYMHYFIPFIIAFLCLLPGIVQYSKKELTIRQILFRKFLQLIILEIVVLGCQNLLGIPFGFSAYAAIAISVVFIYAALHIVEWLYSKSEADQMNRKLEAYRAGVESGAKNRVK